MTATEQSQEMAIVEHEPHVAMAVQVAPQVSARELVARLTVIEDAMRTAMKQDVDYGVIPGTGKKPTLLKPGAEKLGALFQLDVQLENEKLWHDDGHLTVISRATIYHQPTGTRLGSGEGICTTREAKYAYRKAERVCPACGAAAIIKGKPEYGGGWLCWANHKTTPGCGTKYPDGSPEIEGQDAGQIANPNIADAYNTVDKMASKRARIDAVLAVTGASALFTQDIEDFAADAADKPAAAGAFTAGAAGTPAGAAVTASERTAAPAPQNGNGPIEPGDFVLTFGKHKGKTLAQVDNEDSSYLDWLGENGRDDARLAVEAFRAFDESQSFLPVGAPDDDDIPF